VEDDVSENIEVVVVTPPVAEVAPDTDLVNLTEYIHRRLNGDESYAYGLGGPFGYGIEYDNDVFSMFPFYWGECTCGHEEKADAFWKSNPHAAACYQTGYRAEHERLRSLGLTYDEEHRRLTDWAKANGCARAPFGEAVYCDCGASERGTAWSVANQHDPVCPIVRPNFVHKASGVHVRWYKWIGRDMEWSRTVSPREWRRMFDECVASVGLSA
jgi:hypothetical protein